MGKTLIGRHINTSYGFVSSVEYGKSIGCDIIQIFLGNPQQIISKAKANSDLLEIKKEAQKHHVKIIIHGSYTINLCQPVGSSKFKTSVKSLVQDLKACQTMDAMGVIIHMGKNVQEDPLEEVIENYVTGLREALKETKGGSMIVLETGAGQGSEVGSDLIDLAAIYHSLSESEKERIGFCIDTCHVWAAGYDISTKSKTKKFLKTFDHLIGAEKLVCFHLNDSKKPLEAKVDRHADLGYGMIDLEGIKEICYYAAHHDIPLIMETPLDSIDPKTGNYVESKKELKRVRSWIEHHIQSKNELEKN